MSKRASGPHGLLLLDKPGGLTSHDLVARTRRALGTRKVGHAGTLDPMATGLMLLGVGDATRLLTFFVGVDKTYEATVRFGQSTNTEDADGEITAVSDPAVLAQVTEKRILDAASQLTGDIEQVPSAVSAIKVDGKRAYQRVRDGEDVELPARPVRIEQIELLGIERVGTDAVEVVDARIRVACSSGTYVRALARDLGARLDVGAHLTALRRTRIGAFELADARAEPVEDALIAPASGIRRRYQTVAVSEDAAKALRHGQRVPAPKGFSEHGEPLAVLDPAGALIGLVEIRDGTTRTLMNMPERVEQRAQEEQA